MAQKPILSKESLEKRLQISNFHPNAILRGAELTIVGGQLRDLDGHLSLIDEYYTPAYRALQNPRLFTSEHYKQAAIAVAAGIAIRLFIAIPIVSIKVLLWFLSFILDFEHSTWDNDVVKFLDFVSNYVLQVPFFLMTMMRHLSPTLDNMFMESLAWVDKTYYEKHKEDSQSVLREAYYPNLRMYPRRDGSTHSKSTAEAITVTLIRFGKKAGISLAIFGLSYMPIVGRLVLPAASFYTFNKVVGLGPAAMVFGTGLFLPRRYLVVFLQSYFASRSLVRELLEPYFSRIKFTKDQKRHWFHDREGVLFGFGVGFYILLRIPLLGVLIYGIAEASTALLITKITNPPPPPAQSEDFARQEQQWSNKHQFLNLSLSELDAFVSNARQQRSEISLDEHHASSSAVSQDPQPAYTA